MATISVTGHWRILSFIETLAFKNWLEIGTDTGNNSEEDSYIIISHKNLENQARKCLISTPLYPPLVSKTLQHLSRYEFTTCAKPKIAPDLLLWDFLRDEKYE